MDKEQSPIRETTDEARALGQGLLRATKHAALAVIDPQTGAPMVSRIALHLIDNTSLLTLISDLSQHTKALKASPICSLLVGEPGEKGDPLTHPRITLQAQARTLDKAAHREKYLAANPKATLYIDFAGFNFVAFTVKDAHLNGGFGKAFHLTPDDLGLKS